MPALNRITAAVIIAAALILVACGDDDDPNGPAENDLVGRWILQSANQNGTPIAVAADTLIFRTDFTGHYGSTSSIESYDFEFWVVKDSLFSSHTAGPSTGITDTARYSLNDDLDELTRIIQRSATITETQLWDYR